MPPKLKITKDAIVSAAVDIVRTQGAQALNARTVAAALHCSTQPVFSNFPTMEALRRAVVEAAAARCQNTMQAEIAKGGMPAYKAIGMGYLRFAQEEKELFRLLYMRDRTAEPPAEKTALDARIAALVQQNTGLNEPDAARFHLEMWAFVHGIAAMLATGFLELEQTLISEMLTDAYQGLLHHHCREG